MTLSSQERERMLALARANREPFYVYFRERLREDYDRLRSALPSACEIHYSLKANPSPAIVEFLGSLGAGADCASMGELKVALAAKISGWKMSFTGPAKSDAELAFALENGCGKIAVESVLELRRLGALARKVGVSARILVRVNPLRYISSSGRPIESASSQFGIDEENLSEFFSVLENEKGVELLGVHVFTQGQVLDAQSAVKNIESTLMLAGKIRREYGADVRCVDFGLGFGVPYFAGQAPLDLEPVADFFKRAQGLPLEMVAESGRFLAARSGFYVARIVDRKVSRGRTYLIVAGGLNHHLAAAGFGQAVRRNFPVQILEREGGSSIKATIAGPTCYSLDTLAHEIELPDAQVGEHIAIGYSGAYGADFSPGNFLSRPQAGQFFV